MSIEKLHDYIAEFREWLDLHGAPTLTQQASLVANWRDELAAAERLLEAKPELPIAFLGPAQQGKSSLINALLGENILAVVGAVGSCTCVITSAHYRPGPHYCAEIDFISLKDWLAELIAMQEALASSPSDDDTDLDREEWEATQKTAREKFNAVDRQETSNDLSHVLKDPRLGLPKDIAEAMATGQPIVVEEEKAITLRNKVRRYLVGREQHEEGQFWPLISRVRIYGEFEVLSNGVVLIDLPGLNDPNPAREQVTKKYLEEARSIWLACNSQTGIDRVFAQVLRDNGFFFRLFLEGRLGAFSVIATRIDDINLEAVLAQMGTELKDFDGNYAAPLEFRRKQIHRTRQSLSSGMVATASSFTGPAYAEAGDDPGGTGIKRRMLDTLARYAERHAPSLFINMRQELTEGVTVLQTAMKPQLSKIVGCGEGILDHFRQNMGGRQIVTPELREKLQDALDCLPLRAFSR